MESVAITIIDEADTINKEVDGAKKKFENEFGSNKMDVMIHRFPAGLGGVRSRYPYIVPRFVAIGPYHQGEEHLKKMEEVKKAAAKFFCDELLGLHEPRVVTKKMEASKAVNEARGRYVDHMMEGTTRKDGHAATFAAMMFYDACFLLLYMVAYTHARGKEEDYHVNPSMRRFLFSNRDSINNDIMLLENQLPWPVIQALMGAVSEGQKRYLLTAVGKFIAGMGNAFKVCETLNHEPDFRWDDENNPPPHLLALLRRHKTENHTLSPSPSPLLSSPSSSPSQDDERRPLLNNCLGKIITKIKIPAAPKTPQVTSSISSVSAMELQEIGIRLKASKTAAFSDMGFVEGRFWSDLYLAPLSLSDARASGLVNMAALEVCTASRFGDDPGRTAVCSYLALLAMFMVREEDVHTLRAKGLLHGPHSNTEMLTFFKTAVNHLPDGGSRYAHIMKDIAEYRAKRYIWIPVYRWVYNNYKTIITVVSILGTVVGLFSALFNLSKHK